MRRKPHPQTENDNPKYQCFKNKINNIHDHSANLCYVRGELDEFHDWEPVVDDGFVPSDTCPGSAQRIVDMQLRLEAGYPLFHPDDRMDVVDRDKDILGGLPVRQDVPNCRELTTELINQVRKERGLDEA